MSEEINDDVFEYDNGMSQCISGFGRNAIENIMHWANHPEESDEDGDQPETSVRWHIGELVRWCRGLNRKAKEAEEKLLLIRRMIESDRLPNQSGA